MAFSASDARRTFISDNPQMWQFFEPELRKRLSEIEAKASATERVKSLLLELLPSGQASIEQVAEHLHVSKRTLQRRLNDEETNFKDVLSEVRASLAMHYITRSELPYNQISFLLGYEDPNSFFRAFQGWTGRTPDTVRLGA